jgi:hypothetical protein
MPKHQYQPKHLTEGEITSLYFRIDNPSVPGAFDKALRWADNAKKDYEKLQDVLGGKLRVSVSYADERSPFWWGGVSFVEEMEER